MNIKEIIEAWSIANNPTPSQKTLAELRGEVCENCPAKKTKLKIAICKECGCPISKKVFTNNYNPCPLKKWEEIDKPYFKSKPTLI
jgi:hypothetical protein